jgi:cellulose biosynthesis protein BcsQ
VEHNKETESQSELAKDVARLYSYAHVQEGSYRVFTHSPKPHPSGRPLTEVSQSEASTVTPAPPPPVAAAPPKPATTSAQPSPAPSSPALQAPFATHPLPPIHSALGEPGTTSKTAIGIVSIAGGVGKTTLAANLGRILGSRSEHVLLVDASGSGLLPFYFGAEDLRSGLRTFLSPEPDSLPVRVLGTERVTHEWLEHDVRAAMQTAERTIFDLGPGSFSLLPEILPLCAVILVPLLTDLNSIMSIPRCEANNAALRGERGLDVPLPVYVSNKYDEASERERMGRELIAKEIGDRLLPISIRRSADVTEAIAQRMTVVDYAPESEITKDLYQLAVWLQQAAPAVLRAKSVGRWSEA